MQVHDQVSFIFFVLAHAEDFALYGRVTFMKAVLAFTLRASLRLFKSAPCGLVFIQRKVAKRKATLPCWPAVSLCASAWSGRCGSRYRSDSPRAIPLQACSARQHKRGCKINNKVKTCVASDTVLHTPSPLFRHTGVGRYPEIV